MSAGRLFCGCAGPGGRPRQSACRSSLWPSSAWYFIDHSIELARHVQRGMMAHLGLRDLGVTYGNLALIRPTWMPVVLCEGAFLMIPEHEAALRTADYQESYALGVADGLEGLFRTVRR